jgi:hypothetical protein
MQDVDFFTDSSSESNAIEGELRRRAVRYRRSAVTNGDQIAPGIRVGRFYFAGSAEIRKYFFGTLDNGYEFDDEGAPVPVEPAAAHG